MNKTIAVLACKIILLFFFLVPYLSHAQKNLRVSVLNEAVSMPTTGFLQTPIHPGLSIGTDFRVKSGEHWQKTLGADVSFFHHRLSENAVMLDVAYALGYKFGFGLQPKFLAAVGYKHSLAAGEVYELKNGSYEETTYLGKSQFNAKLGLGLEYALNERYSLMADYRTMVALPYSQKLPFSLHTLLSVGMKVNFKN